MPALPWQIVPSLILKPDCRFICSTGASRGIGLEIAKSLARKGVNVAVAAKSAEPHPKLPGTIHTAAQEVTEIGEQTGSGAKGLAIQLDVRDAKAVEDAIEQTVSKFGHLDYAVNNVSCPFVPIFSDLPATGRSDLMSSSIS